MLGTGHDVGRCGGVGVREKGFRKRVNVGRIAMMFCMLGKMVTIQKMEKKPQYTHLQCRFHASLPPSPTAISKG